MSVSVNQQYRARITILMALANFKKDLASGAFFVNSYTFGLDIFVFVKYIVSRATGFGRGNSWISKHIKCLWQHKYSA